MTRQPGSSSCCLLLVLAIFVTIGYYSTDHVSTSFLLNCFMGGPHGFDCQRWTKQQAGVISSKNPPNKMEKNRCTAQVLFDKPEGWVSLDGQLKWQVSEKARSVCNLDEPFLVPLQSAPHDIQQSLSKKWLVIIGDSSVRMMHDYLVGRWLGNLTHWPDAWDNHGPGNQHADMCAGPDKKCHFDAYNRGARVTFVWNSLLYTGELDAILRNNIGLPDVVVGQHGYWEKTWTQDSTLNATQKEIAILKSLKNAQSIPNNITSALERHEMESLYRRAYNPIQHGEIHKIWMTFFNMDELKNSDPDSSGDLYDGSLVAEKLGWDIFDRSILVNAEGDHEGAHPMNEVLEIELEILLLILRNM